MTTLTTTHAPTSPCSRCGVETATTDLLPAEVGCHICPSCHHAALASWPSDHDDNWK